MPISEDDEKVYALPLLQAGRHEDDMDRIINEARTERYELPVGAARKVAYLSAVILSVFFLWTALARIDIVATSRGQLRPYGKPKLVQSEVSGKINKIAVREGSHVNQNEVLVELDSSIYQEQLEQKLLTVQQEKIKLSQMKQGRDSLSAVIAAPSVLPTVVSDVGDVAQTVNDVFASQKSLMEAKYDASLSAKANLNASQPPGEMSALTNILARLGEQRKKKKEQIALLSRQNEQEEAQRRQKIASLKQQLANHTQMLDELNQESSIAHQQEKDYAKVLDIGVSQMQYLEIKQKTAEANKRVLDEKNAIATLESELEFSTLDLPRWKLQCQNEILKAETELINNDGSMRDIQIKMRSSSRDLDQAQAKADAALERARASLSGINTQLATQAEVVKAANAAAEETRKLVDKSSIRAAMSGTVTDLSIRSLGEVVSSGEQLMQILPDHGAVVMEATVSNVDIAFVRTGQDVKLKLDAFPYQDFGVLHGTVSEIEQFPEPDKDGKSGYLVRIVPQRLDVMVHGKAIPLKDGLTAECDIILRKMTVLQALLRPFTGLNYMNVKA